MMHTIPSDTIISFQFQYLFYIGHKKMLFLNNSKV